MNKLKEAGLIVRMAPEEAGPSEDLSNVEFAVRSPDSESDSSCIHYGILA